VGQQAIEKLTSL